MQKRLLQRVSAIHRKTNDWTSEKIEYQHYKMNTKELMKYSIQGIFLLALTGYFFYRSVAITIMISPFLVLYLLLKKKELCKQRKNILNIQFKEALTSVHASLQAGYSLENAFFEAYKDMAVFYGKESLIAKELIFIKKGIRNNRTLEEMLIDLGKRSMVEDIQDFASVIVAGKKSGGNINEIIESSIMVVEEKVSVLMEIETMISSRKFEQRIMNAIPFLIIFYVELTSKNFFSILYTSFLGRIIMSICLIIYFFSLFLSRRIMNIEI